MKPGQNLCVNCMKLYQEQFNFAESSDDDKNDNHTAEYPYYIDHEMNYHLQNQLASEKELGIKIKKLKNLRKV